MKLARNACALLLVDLQRAFCDDRGSMAAHGRDIGRLRRVVYVSHRLADAARKAGVPVAWTRMVFRPDYADGDLLRRCLGRRGGGRAGNDECENGRANCLAHASIPPSSPQRVPPAPAVSQHSPCQTRRFRRAYAFGVAAPASRERPRDVAAGHRRTRPRPAVGPSQARSISLSARVDPGVQDTP